MKISIDTDQDTFDSAIKAVHAAYGIPFQPTAAPDADAPEGDEDFLPNSWTRRRLKKLAEWVGDTPAGVALRFIAENAPAVPLDEALAYVEEHTEFDNVDGKAMGGIMSSVGHARRAIGGVTTGPYETDYNARKYRMDPRTAKALLEEFEALGL